MPKEYRPAHHAARPRRRPPHRHPAPASWDEALDRAADGLRAAGEAHGPTDVRALQLLEGDQRGELRRAEVRPRRPRQQQHRQLQPHLTRPLCRRSGDRVRRWRRHQLISRGRGDGPHPPVGHERPGDAPDLLPPPPEGGAPGARLYRHRPAPHQLGRVGGPVAGPRRRAPTSRSPTRWRREIIHAGLANEEFIDRATSGFEDYRQSVEPYTLEYAERETGVPADAIREAAHAYAKADRAMICWTLGITEHHNAVDNVLALITSRC